MALGSVGRHYGSFEEVDDDAVAAALDRVSEAAVQTGRSAARAAVAVDVGADGIGAEPHPRAETPQSR